MQSRTPSRTAMGTALMRALHTRADPLRLIDDPWGDRLLEPARAIFEARMREMHPGAERRHATEVRRRLSQCDRARSVLRGRAESAVERGLRQYVIVGAGFDSFALRRPDWAADVAVIEVDHPATQNYKLERLKACGLSPQGVSFIAADLSVEPLSEALKRSSFRSGEPAFFAWLGVTMYLTREANLATFREIAKAGGKGGELVFTYAHIQRFDEAAARSPRYQRMREMVELVGEPFVSGFDPATIGAELAACGLSLLEDHGTGELVRRYDPEGLNGMRADSLGRIARAVVA